MGSQKLVTLNEKCSFKVTHYSFMIAWALTTEVQVICSRSKGNVRFFYVNMSTKSKTDSGFSRVSLDEIL